MAELEQVDAKAEQEASFTLTQQEREATQTLAQDLSALWQAETTTTTDRKQLLRLVIESVQLDRGSHPGWIEIQICWRSGVTTRLEVKRVQPGEGSLKTPAQAVARINELAASSSYVQIAEILNAEGWRTAFGRTYPPNMWAIFVDGMDADGKDLAPSQELLAKPESEAAETSGEMIATGRAWPPSLRQVEQEVSYESSLFKPSSRRPLADPGS